MKPNDTSNMDVTRPYERNGNDSGSFQLEPALTLNLSDKYKQIVNKESVAWKLAYDLISRLGSGGQGDVFLARREGAFGKFFEMALKFYRPDGYKTVEAYRHEMARLAQVGMEVAEIQQDHVLDVYNVVEYQGILVLAMELVKGYDLRELLVPQTLMSMKASVTEDRWSYINEVVMTNAGLQSRFMPGVAISILRECLVGVAALHRAEIIHADLKPANVMVKTTGNVKIIDLGSAFNVNDPPLRPTWTPRYAAVEVLEGARHSPLSDLASLGYVFFELLTGVYPFAAVAENTELIRLKKELWKRFPELLPDDVARNATIVEMISKMIAPDPADRFQSLDEADLSRQGASEIQHQLVRTNLSTDGPNEMRRLVSDLANGMQIAGNDEGGSSLYPSSQSA